MKKLFKRLSAPQIIAAGFALVILVGSGLLMLPCSVREGVQLKYIDALYTSVSAVCVTGLSTVDAGGTYTLSGQIILLLLMQVGGLGVASVGAGVIMLVGRRVDLKGRGVIREAMNLDSGKGIVRFLRSVFLTTIIFQAAGALLSFISFAKTPKMSLPRAVWVSIFHSVAAFNNSGFDVLGGGTSLFDYKDDLLLNLVTCALVFFGGIGFLVIREAVEKKFRWKKMSMHARVVISTSVVLIVAGTLLIKICEGANISWIGAFFYSVSTRTAGFSTYRPGEFSVPTLLIMCVLMVIGASPGSTGGGIKTSTFFALLQGIKSSATNKSEKAFKYSLPKNAFKKASVIILLALGVIITGTVLLMMLEPEIELIDGLFEIASAFGTVGLSTGITPSLGTGAKLLSIVIMYVGRLGPLTIATLWYFDKGERVSYPEGNIAIG